MALALREVTATIVLWGTGVYEITCKTDSQLPSRKEDPDKLRAVKKKRKDNYKLNISSIISSPIAYIRDSCFSDLPFP